MYKMVRYDWEAKKDVEETILVGCSFYVTEEVVRVMSDVWENQMTLVSIDEEGKIRKNYIDSKKEYQLDGSIRNLEIYRKRIYDDVLKMETDNLLERNQNPATKGLRVRVVRGRTAVGTEGLVVVSMDAQYGMGWHSSTRKKIAIATTDRKIKVEKYGRVYENYADVVWVWACNCEVIEPAPLTEEETRRCRYVAGERADVFAEQFLKNMENARKHYPYYNGVEKVKAA